MPVPAIVIDGSQPYGTPTVTINGQAYKLNNISIERAVDKAMDRNSDGRPQRQRWTIGVDTLTAEAQYPSSGTTVPIFGQTFNVTVDPAYGSELWCVQPQNYTATNGEGDIRIIPLRAEKVINGSVTTVT